MFNERLIDTLKELNFWLKRISDGDYSGGGSDDGGGSDGGGSDDGGGSGVAPLVVEGTFDYNGGLFVPNNGQPTWNEAKEAFVSGRTVVCSFEFNGSTRVETVVGYAQDQGQFEDQGQFALSGFNYLNWREHLDDGEGESR